MRDDRRGNGVEQLRARIVTEQQSGELIVFDQRHGVTVLPVLHRDTDAVSKKLPNIDRILGNFLLTASERNCPTSIGYWVICTVVTSPSVASKAPVGSSCHAASRSPTTVSGVISSGVIPSKNFFSVGSSSARFAS